MVKLLTSITSLHSKANAKSHQFSVRRFTTSRTWIITISQIKTKFNPLFLKFLCSVATIIWNLLDKYALKTFAPKIIDQNPPKMHIITQSLMPMIKEEDGYNYSTGYGGKFGVMNDRKDR